VKRMVAVALLAGATIVARAEDDERPERGVARISLINGEVSVRRGDTGDWVAAAINAPLVVEDRVLTGPSSRAEVQFDYANMIRLSRDTEVRLARLDYRRYQLQLARGTATFRVLRDSDADVDIDTPAVAVRPLKRGIYRMTVHDNGETEITVRSGEAEIYTPRGTERLRGGRTMVARGTASDPEYRTIGEIPEDEWDRWNERRDRDLERSRSYNYISRDIYGAEDLDAYGSWYYDAPYGYVWAPRVAVGWAPYRYGRWAWVDWYGWSWVSYDPWGWAPFHYGRWYYGSRGWCWWPGGFRSRHYWRPGLVAFVGWNHWGGTHIGIGVGFGRVGWIPLGPHEPYYPWYGRRYYGGFRHGGRIDNSVTIVNNVNITNVYRNARVRDGITAIDGNDFHRGRIGAPLRAGDAELGRATLVRGQMPHAPSRDSLRLSDREARAPERSSGEGRFFSRQPARSVDRVSFEDQRRGVEEIARRSFGDQGRSDEAVRGGGERRAEAGGSRVAEQGGRSAEAGGRAAEPGRVAEQGGRFRDQESRASEQGGRTAEGGWQRFGGPRGVETRGGEVRGGETRASDASSDARGWRRIGETSRSSEAQPSTRSEAVERGGETRGASGRTAEVDASGWRRFGEPMRGQERDPSSGLMRRSEGRGSESRANRIESPREAPREAEIRRDDRSSESRRSETRRFESPRSESPRSESPRVERRSEEPVRVSPPIVRERPSAPEQSAPSRRSNEFRVGEGSSRSRSFEGFGSRSSGGYSSPSRSPSYSSPRGGDGGGRVMGGGGGGRVMGGGGRSTEGGGRSSGGGSRSSGGSRGGRNR
jgi:hypothetical protein